jgi:hypothetical protein
LEFSNLSFVILQNQSAEHLDVDTAEVTCRQRFSTKLRSSQPEGSDLYFGIGSRLSSQIGQTTPFLPRGSGPSSRPSRNWKI